jgi:hypothetical protein
MTEIKVGPLSMHYFLPLQNAVEADLFRKFAVKELLFRSVRSFKKLIRGSGRVKLSLVEWLVNDEFRGIR